MLILKKENKGKKMEFKMQVTVNKAENNKSNKNGTALVMQ